MPQVFGRVTDDARRGFGRACHSGGVTMAALLEALGRALLDDPTVIPPEVYEEARTVDIERGSRS